MRSSRPAQRLAGKRILVTGASGGIGGAIVDALAGEGADVVLSGRDETRLRARAAAVGGEVLVADLAQSSGVAALSAAAATCDAVVCNAAEPGEGLAAAVSSEEVERVMDVNLVAPLHIATSFLRSRQAMGRPGAIILVGSVAGVVASAELSLYNASKFGLRGFALALAAELRGTDCWVTHITPGYISGAGMFADSGHALPWWARARSPQDVAATVVRGLVRPRPELWVAPLELRLAARLVALAPGLTAPLRGPQRPAGTADDGARISPGRPETDEG